MEPRGQKLLTLLASLGDETTRQVGCEYPILMSAKHVEYSPRQLFVAILCVILCFVVVLSIGFTTIIYLAFRAQAREHDGRKAQPTQRLSSHR